MSAVAKRSMRLEDAEIDAWILAPTEQGRHVGALITGPSGPEGGWRIRLDSSDRHTTWRTAEIRVRLDHGSILLNTRAAGDDRIEIPDVWTTVARAAAEQLADGGAGLPSSERIEELVRHADVMAAELTGGAS